MTIMDDQLYREQVQTWSLADLIDVAAHLDKEGFPNRYSIVQAELKRRQAGVPPVGYSPPITVQPSKYATFWPRVGANIIDSLLFSPLIIPAQYLAASSSEAIFQALPEFVTTVLFYTYSIALHGRFGQTLGKMATGVRVLDLSEEKLSMSQAIRRDIVPLILAVASFILVLSLNFVTDPSKLTKFTVVAVIILGAISFLWSMAEIVSLLTNRKRRALHDFIARSVVIRVA